MHQVTFNEHCDSSKQSSFHSTYTTFCKDKNVPAILELIKSKNKLDFVVDRIRTDHWEMICKSLEQDKTLEYLAIRSRKSNPLGKRIGFSFPILLIKSFTRRWRKNRFREENQYDCTFDAISFWMHETEFCDNKTCIGRTTVGSRFCSNHFNCNINSK